jgi:hypothetical protein
MFLPEKDANIVGTLPFSCNHQGKSLSSLQILPKREGERGAGVKK